MPTNKKNIIEFAETDVDDDTDEVVLSEETVVTQDLKTARIKGTWTMFWGTDRYQFEDGKRYRIPVDLFQYLKARSCIYDTM
jgi:hypothetical protein